MSGAGTRSDGQNPLPFDPYASRETLRLTTVYATPWTYDPTTVDQAAGRPGDVLNLGRLARYYNTSDQQLPRVLRHEALDCSGLGCQRWRAGEPVSAQLWHFLVPSGQVVVALTMDVPGTLIEAIPLLEDLYYATITCAGLPLEQLAAERIGCGPNGDGTVPGFLPERHQLVFRSVDTPDQAPDDDTVQRVIYRTDLPYRPEHSSIRYPAELNRRPTTIGALGPYVSLLCGHQDYIENCVLLSAVQAVGSAARLREIRAVAYTYVHRFRHRATDQGDAHERRTTLEDISDGLSQLEVELSYSVEAGAEIGMLVPALRVESFHQELFAAIGVTERAATIGQMLNRLDNAIAAELTSVESMEQRAADRRRVRTVVAVTFVTTVSGTLGLLFGFFGINASQVDQNRSMFDDHYTPIYALIATILLCALAIFTGMRLQERWEERRDRSRTRTWESTHRLLAREAGAVILDPTTPPSPLPRSRRPENRTRTSRTVSR
ncbi:hypothetical protein [Streptomyces noursei]|uniref:hypothetical protein n=1 Tax=Streptomyces noursei TaxID=1971 RepID=UPI0019870356|nr:hypothetical protein [Streptomyces noursei]MCZ1014842.1 hypothetical protein [Streptomyces noursei]GGX48120.1 hypothetical protein GCM10010341_82180 [Streptomyces noursei]